MELEQLKIDNNVFNEAELRALLAVGGPSWIDRIVPHLLEQQRQSIARPFLRPQFESDVTRAIQTANSAIFAAPSVAPVIAQGQAAPMSGTARDSHHVRLNVGGHRFETTIATLTKEPDSMLSAMFSGRHNLKEDDGYVFVDQDGDVFVHVLSYLRSTSAFVPPKCEVMQQRILAAADYYQLSGLRRLLMPEEEDGETCTTTRESLADRLSFREAQQMEESAAKAEVLLRRRLKSVVAERLKKANFCRHSGGERHSLWAAVKAQYLAEEKEGIQVCTSNICVI
jgi:hypothetical protein